MVKLNSIFSQSDTFKRPGEISTYDLILKKMILLFFRNSFWMNVNYWKNHWLHSEEKYTLLRVYGDYIACRNSTTISECLNVLRTLKILLTTTTDDPSENILTIVSDVSTASSNPRSTGGHDNPFSDQLIQNPIRDPLDVWSYPVGPPMT